MPDLKLPDIPVYLQDFLDMAYVMQKIVLPHCERLRNWRIDYARVPKFSGIQKEYDKVVNILFSSHSFFFCFELKGTKNDKERKAVYFACRTAQALTVFLKPQKTSLLNPNRIDVSMLEGLPAKRQTKATELLKKLFIVDEYGYLIYSPEMVQQNYFSIFRDCRQRVNYLPKSERLEEEYYPNSAPLPAATETADGQPWTGLDKGK